MDWIHLVPVVLSYYSLFKNDVYQITAITIAIFIWTHSKLPILLWWRKRGGWVTYTVEEYDEQSSYNVNYTYVNRYLIHQPEYTKFIQSKVNSNTHSFKQPVNGLETYAWEELGFCSMQIDFKGTKLHINKEFSRQVTRQFGQTMLCNHFVIRAKSFTVIDDFMNECQRFYLAWKQQKERTGKIVYIFSTKDTYWFHRSINVNKTFDNLILEPTIKSTLMQALTSFQSRSFNDFNDTFGMANKIGFLFSGPPGCGKTSTILTISNVTKLPIYCLHPSEFEDDVAFKKAIDMIPNRVLFVLEDIDCCKEFHDRAAVVVKEEESKDDKKEKRKDYNRLKIMLEFLDGYKSLEGSIVIMTANFPERLDKALIRPGRIDFQFEFKPVASEQVFSFVSGVLGTKSVTASVPSQTSVAELMNKYRMVCTSQK